MKFIFSILLCLLSFGLFAQKNSSVPKQDKKAIAKFEKAQELLKERKTEKAIGLLEELSVSNPNFYDARFRLAWQYLYKKENDKAVKEFAAIVDLKDPPDRELIFPYVAMLEKERKFDQAISAMAKLHASVDSTDQDWKLVSRRMEELHFRKKVFNEPFDIEIEALSPAVNSKHSEYLPAFNSEGTVMLFTRALSFHQSADLYGLENEDMYMTELDSLGNFSEAVPIIELNTPGNEGAHCFSQDGKILIFTACDRHPKQNGCDLFISFRKRGMWSEPVNMGPKINTRHWDSQPSLSPDNRTMYFCSSRKGGYGGKDIWKVELTPTGWSDPINLGPQINTAKNEESPFLHADNKTLYFRSDGHLGLGNSDLFIARRTGNGWSEPINMGYPINSEKDDGALFVEFNGNMAYYSTSQDDGVYKYDIVRFELPDEFKPEKVSFIKVNVIDKENGTPLSAEVSLTSLDEESRSRSIRTDEKGSALLVIQQGSYLVSVDKEKYIFFSENMSFDQNSAGNARFIYNIPLEKIKIEDRELTGVLNNIFFESGSANLLDKSNKDLQLLYKLLTENPDIKLSIIGHTDSVGTEEDNLALSEQRAQSVYKALIDLGADENRIDFSGKGESEAISSNDTEEGRSVNRRTEFKITKLDN